MQACSLSIPIVTLAGGLSMYFHLTSYPTSLLRTMTQHFCWTIPCCFAQCLVNNLCHNILLVNFSFRFDLIFVAVLQRWSITWAPRAASNMTTPSSCYSVTTMKTYLVINVNEKWLGVAPARKPQTPNPKSHPPLPPQPQILCTAWNLSPYLYHSKALSGE